MLLYFEIHYANISRIEFEDQHSLSFGLIKEGLFWGFYSVLISFVGITLIQSILLYYIHIYLFINL